MLKQKALNFKTKYQISNQSSLKHIKRIIRAMNCNLCRYSDEKLKLIELGVDAEAQGSPALTVISPEGDITVYYNDRKSPSIQRFALCHEIGHIILKHKYSDIPPLLQEQEADLFAELLLSSPVKKKKPNPLKIGIGIFITLFITIVITFTILFATLPKFLPLPDAASDSVEISASDIESKNSSAGTEASQTVYYAKYGEVYHKTKDCYHLKKSKSIYSGSIENSGKDRPCSACW